MKQRFSSLDIKVIVHELATELIGLRVHNIYDLSSRIFLFKFHAPERRQQLLIDSGFRCHLTSFVRETASAPSPYVTKLRKSLKTRRVTSVSQVGTDRIIEFQFSDGLYRLYLEFYAGGNIVLTDKDLNVLSALRRVEEGPEHEHVKVGSVYNLDQRQNFGGTPALSLDRLRQGLSQAVEKQKNADSSAAKNKKSKKKGNDSLRRALAVSINELPPLLLEHAFHTKKFDSAVSPEDVLADEGKLNDLFAALQEAEQVVAQITATSPAKGYIIAKQQAGKVEAHKAAAQPDDSPRILYDDYHPFKPAQFESDDSLKILEYEGFNKTVDEFYSSLEGQKLESRLAEREQTARKKIQAAHADHAKRIGGLQQVQELNIRKGEALVANVERVEEAIAAVNGLIAQAMDWVDIARLIEQEQGRGNSVAQLIKLPLKLMENTVTLLLGEAETDEDLDSGYVGSDTESSDDSDNEETSKAPKKQSEILSIDVDLSLSPWANASQYYDQKKTAAVKEEKTMQASTKALKSTETKINAALAKGLKQEKDILRPVRKPFWFEKFHYFVSSDGYLVIGGKDAQQNELLYRRYLRKGDVYVHADLHGASSVIIKNNPSTPDAPIPPSTLSQAGNLSVCASGAWESKAVMAAWWVEADQVSKTAPTGEYLQAGSFMIRGKKNFLPPSQLLMGMAIMWQISDDSKFRHTRHRLTSDGPPAADTTTKADAEGTEEDLDAREAIEGDAAEDSDEDFPDAKVNDDEDSDEDFPDSKPVDSDSEAEDRGPRSNPLQANGAAADDDTAGETADEDMTADDTADEDADYMMSGGNAPATSTDAVGATTARKHMSAHERRLLKKGKALPNSGADAEDSAASDVDVDGPSAAEDTPASKPKANEPVQKNKPLPRGKRSKAKRAAAKYANQDDEDRELAMTILGSKAGQEAAATAAADKKIKDEEDRANKERRKAQHLRKLEAEEKQRSLGREIGKEPLEVEDEGEEDTEEARKNELADLDSLVGKPLAGDELLSAILVCAPWAALGTYKYKIKLQPGSVKKGKAVKEMLSKWQAAVKNPKAIDQSAQDTEKIWPREGELVAGLKDVEGIGNMPMRTVRLVMGGGASGDKTDSKGKKVARGNRGSKKK